MTGGKWRRAEGEGRGENLPLFLSAHPTPAAQAINVEILALRHMQVVKSLRYNDLGLHTCKASFSVLNKLLFS